MSSQTWLPQEVQPTAPGVTSQAPISGSPLRGPVAGPPPAPRGPSAIASDPLQESIRAKFVTGPGYVVPAPSFSYSVVSTANSSGSSHQSPSTPVSSQVVKFTPSVSAASLQPPVPGQSSVSGPSFSYSIVSHASVGSSSVQQFQSTTAAIPNLSQGGKFAPTTATSLQPPVPVPNNMPPPPRPPFSVPKGNPSNATGFSFSGSSQSPVEQQGSHKNLPSNSSASAAGGQVAGPTPLALSGAQSMPLPVQTSSNSLTSLRMPTAPSFPAPLGIPRTPGTPGPPGIPLSASLSSSISVQPAAMDSTPASLRPTVPSTVPTPSTSAQVPVAQNVQQQMYPVYPSLPAMVPPPPALWLHAPQVGGLQRPPFLPFPGVFSCPFPLPPRAMPLPPPVALPDSQPPGVSPIGPPGGIPSVVVGLGQQQSNLETQSPPPGIDQDKQANDVSNKDGDVVQNEVVDAWMAHKTDTGIVYYYNALTGDSTYDKPSSFKGEPEKVTAQPTPVSWEKLVGTEWVLVATNDGKKYYYNAKDKVSSWQVPPEVADLRKKQAGESSKTTTVSGQNVGALTDKGPAPISLSTPAINTGGRDAMSLRASVAPVGSSALDLIKKKLQEAGMPTTSSPLPASSVPATSDLNSPRVVESTGKGPQSENNKDKLKDANGDGNVSDSSSDSDDVDSGPTKEERVIQFREMLKERGVAPFSKWDRELPKILFDPRFKAIPGYSERRALFEHYVRTRAEEERKEKRAAQKAAIEGFKQLLEEASEDIDHKTDYETFKRKWCHDPRFEALDRKERELLLNERVLPLRKAVEEKVQAVRAAAVSSFKSMLRDKGDINTSSRWSKVKDSLRNDPRYKSVKHEDREVLFNEYISQLKAAEQDAEHAAKSKREEEEKLKEREREMRKRKEREEHEMERVRLKARRKDAVVSYQALLTEKIKDPKASWTESKPKLEKDPLGRAANPDLEQGDMEKLFREHVKILYERCAREFRALLSDILAGEAATLVSDDGKTFLNSWSTAKRVLKPDPRYSRMPRKERESLWRRYGEEILRRQKVALDPEEKAVLDHRNSDHARRSPASRRNHSRR